jgi:ABC-type amino acid transport substrate-binding protein
MPASAFRPVVRAVSGLFAAALAFNAAQARPLEEVKQKGEVSVCANPDALPYASNKPDAPGFQIEIARAIAAKMGVRLRVDWIVPTMRASTVDCDLLMDAIVDPAVRRPGVQLSTPYQKSGVALVFAPGHAPVAAYRDLQAGTRVGVLMNSVASLVVSRTPARIFPFGFEDDLLSAVSRGEVDAGAVSPASIGYYNFTHPGSALSFSHAEDSEPELRWQVAVGVRRADAAMVQAVDGAVRALLAEGALTAIYARYGVAHRAP